MCFLGHSINVVELGEIIGEIYTKEEEALDHLHFNTIDAN